MKAWIFDVDGVITNLTKESVEKQEVLDRISNIIKDGEVVGFITGRGFDWLNTNVLDKMPNFHTNPQILERLFIVCEFGGVTVLHENGVEKKIIDQEIIVPQEVSDEGSKILEKYKNHIIREDKETLFTVKIKPGTLLDEFTKEQEKASRELENLLEKDNLSEEFEVHTDRLGLNVRNKKSTKHHAIDKLLLWIQESNFPVTEFIVFGDSESDLEMGEELTKKGMKFSFVFVGENLEQEPNFEVIKTEKHYDEGTLEYLEKNT